MQPFSTYCDAIRDAYDHDALIRALLSAANQVVWHGADHRDFWAAADDCPRSEARREARRALDKVRREEPDGLSADQRRRWQLAIRATATVDFGRKHNARQLAMLAMRLYVYGNGGTALLVPELVAEELGITTRGARGVLEQLVKLNVLNDLGGYEYSFALFRSTLEMGGCFQGVSPHNSANYGDIAGTETGTSTATDVGKRLAALEAEAMKYRPQGQQVATAFTRHPEWQPTHEALTEPMSAGELAKVLGISRDATLKRLKRMKGDNLVEVIGERRGARWQRMAVPLEVAGVKSGAAQVREEIADANRRDDLRGWWWRYEHSPLVDDHGEMSARLEDMYDEYEAAHWDETDDWTRWRLAQASGHAAGCCGCDDRRTCAEAEHWYLYRYRYAG